MNSELVPRRSPELLVNFVNNDYGYAVNCSHPNSFRVLNRRQLEILQAVDGRTNLAILAGRLNLVPESLERFLAQLARTEIIRFDDAFSRPQRPGSPDALNFWIHTTNACNLGCSYCYIPTLNTGRGMAAGVRLQLLAKFVEAAQLRGIRAIKLRLAGGEPLTQFRAWQAFIPDAVETLLQYGCRLDIGFITNLTILSDEIVTFAKRYNIGFGVSLDGVGAYHDATRQFRSGAGSFEVVDAHIKRLLKEQLPVSINTVVTNYNLAGLPALTRYLIALDVPFRYSIVKGEAIDAELLEKYLSETYRIMGEAIETGWSFFKRFQFCDLKPNDLGSQTCASGFSGGAIYVDGTFKYCHVQFGEKTDSPYTIFNEDLDLVGMIASGEHHEDAKSDDCRKCRYRSVCTSGCPVYRVDGKDPQCSLYHRFIPKYYELLAKERLALLQQ